MDIEVLKRQLGKNILNSVDRFQVVRKNESSSDRDHVILKNENRTAKIILNSMDLYNITLIENNEIVELKENIYNNQLREIVNNHFNFSLLQAKQNNDKDRVKEIEKNVKSGKTVRII